MLLNVTGGSTAKRLYRLLSDPLEKLKFHEHRFLLAGHTISLQAATKELLEYLNAAFQHLPVSACVPKLRIRIGVDDQTRVTPGGDAEEIVVVGGHRFWVSPDRRFVCHTIASSDSWYCVDRQAGEIVGLVRSIDRMATFERAKPVVRPLLLWLEQADLTPVHAGMVSWQESGILFGGRGGSGKSTASLSSLRAGLGLLAEDYTLLEASKDGTFVAHSLYSSAWVEPDHLFRFPGLAERAIRGDQLANGKCILLLQDIHPERMVTSVPVRYLVLPRVRAGGVTALHKASRAEGLKRFGLESMVTLTRLGSAELRRLTALVQSVDCYWLDLGADLDQVGVLLKRLVEQRSL